MIARMCIRQEVGPEQMFGLAARQRSARFHVPNTPLIYSPPPTTCFPTPLSSFILAESTRPERRVIYIYLASSNPDRRLTT